MTMHTQDQLRLFAETMEIRRSLAATEHMLPKGGKGAVAVTSAARGEGKTTVAVALAMAAARNHPDKRVLLIDFNWHDPAVHEAFNLRLDRGLEQVDPADVEALAYPTRVQGLDVLLPTRAVRRGALESANPHDYALALIDKAKEAYDLVIADTRSIFPANREFRLDSAIICAAMDAVVMVALEAVTAKQEVKRALKLLEGAGAMNVGVVLNQWKNQLH